MPRSVKYQSARKQNSSGATGHLIGMSTTFTTIGPPVNVASFGIGVAPGLFVGLDLAGMAVALIVVLCMSGNYVAGAAWPPVIQHFTQSAGWRPTYIGIGIFCLLTMLPLALVFWMPLTQCAWWAFVGARWLMPLHWFPPV